MSTQQGACGQDGAHPVPDGPGRRYCRCGLRSVGPVATKNGQGAR